MGHLLFVYGSLKRGLVHHGQMRGATFVATARLSRHYLVLYEEGYPALVPSDDESDWVEGEIFYVTPEQLARLDEFEEVPTLYQRSEVTLDDGTRAFSYSIAHEIGARWPRVGSVWEE
jgi:gamma-glutamylcyclotransferase (GGCT)/AIG2-like uncharacterized protein YtfP